KRLNRRSRNLLPGSIERLVHRYPLHAFVIDLEEAREIFNNVDSPTKLLYDIYLSRLEDLIKPRRGRPLVEILSREAVETAGKLHERWTARDNGSAGDQAEPGRNSSRAEPTP